MAYQDPQLADFKNYFVRDFVYGTDTTTVMDQDILNALQDATFNSNQGLWPNQSSYFTAQLNLAAHYLVMNLRGASQGVAGQYSWLQNSKSVGNVSESFNIPQRILDNPNFAMLAKTHYGAKYLFMVLPQLSANVIVIGGGTQA